MSDKDEVIRIERDMEILNKIIELLKKMPQESRHRILLSVAKMFYLPIEEKT